MKILIAVLGSLAVLLALAAAGAYLFTSQAKFGQLPAGERLERVRRSPHYADGKFSNLVPKPPLAEGVSLAKISWEFFFRERKRPEPSEPVPFVETDLAGLPREGNLLVWFGHSSYFMQIDGVRYLVDPVLSGHASPFSFTTHAFTGTDRYKAEDMPAADYVLITHDPGTTWTTRRSLP